MRLIEEEYLMYPDYIMHFNPNHDPRNGQFAKGHGGMSSSRTKTESTRKSMTTNQKAAIGAASVAAASLAGEAIKARFRGEGPSVLGASIRTLFTGIDAIQMAKAIKYRGSKDPELVKKGNKHLARAVLSIGDRTISDVRDTIKLAKSNPDVIKLKPEDFQLLDTYLPMKGVIE
jgi:hypothetical protein